MSNEPTGDEPSIELAALQQIERRCTQFEIAVRAGQPREIPTLLDGLDEPAQKRLLEELYAIECDVAGAASAPAILERFRRDFPGFHPATATHDPNATVIQEQADADLEETYRVSSSGDAGAPLPKRIGEYEIMRELGRGGMGRVFEATHQRLGRRVALKVLLNQEFATDADRQRFRAEAEAAARLDHPGIVPIYEIGEDAGRIFYAMAIVDGESLQAQLQRGKLEPRKAADLVRVIALAIEHAHARGVIHRDLKPANILLPRSFTPRVTDFGLARRVDQQHSLTGTGEILGTPGYMSPEQAAGKSRLAGPASDVYGLGAILFACLKGAPPFQGKTLPEVLRQVIEVPPPKLKNYRGTIDADLETIVHKCLEKDPRHRYSTAADLAIDLQRWLKEEPIAARPPSRMRRLAMWYRRDQKGIWATGTLTAAMVALIVVGIWYVTTRRAMQQDVESARTAREEALTASKKSDQEAAAQLKARQTADLARHRREGELLCDQGELTAGLFHLARAWKLAQDVSDEKQRHEVETGLCTHLWRQPRLVQLLDKSESSLATAMPANSKSNWPFRGLQAALSGDGQQLILLDRREGQLYRFARPSGELVGAPASIDSALLEKGQLSAEGRIIVTPDRTLIVDGPHDGQSDTGDRRHEWPTISASAGVQGFAAGLFAWEPALGNFYEIAGDSEALLTRPGLNVGLKVRGGKSPDVRMWDIEKDFPLAEPFSISSDGSPASAWSFSVHPPRLLTVGANRRVQLWDIKARSSIGEEFGEGIASGLLSDDGKQAVLVRDGWHELQLWDLQTRQPLGPIISTPFTVSRMGRLGTSRWAVLAAHPQMGPRLQVVDLFTGKPWITPASSQETLRLAAFNDRHSVIAAVLNGSESNSGQTWRIVRFWDARTGAEIGAPIRHREEVESLLITDAGELVTNDGGSLRVWDLTTVRPRLQRLPWQLQAVDRRSHGAWVAVDQSGVSVPDTHPSMRFWPFAEGGPRGFVVQPADLVVQPQSPRVPILRQLSDSQYQLWSVMEEWPVAPIITCPSKPVACALHSDGNRYLTLHDKDVRQWSTITGEPVGSPIKIPDFLERSRMSGERFGSQPSHLGAQYAQSGREIWVFLDFGRPDLGWVDNSGVVANSEWFGSGSMTLFRQWRRFDAMTGESVGEPQDFGERLLKFQAAPDNSVLRTITSTTGFEAWDLASGRRIIGPLFPDHPNDDQFVRHWLSDDGRWLTVSTGREVRRYSIADGQPAGPPLHLPNEPNNGYRCDFRAPVVSPDGRTLAASACVDHFEMFVFGGAWNLENGDLVKLQIRDARQSNAYRFAPDSRAFLSIEDQQLTVWDAASRTRLGLAVDTPAFAHHLFGVFSPDGDWIITREPLAVGDFHFWPVPSAAINSPETLERWLIRTSGERMKPEGTMEFLFASEWRSLEPNRGASH